MGWQTVLWGLHVSGWAGSLLIEDLVLYFRNLATGRRGDGGPLLQVMDWIENHGEAFLSKHTGVGKSLHRARALQKRHDDFEDVAQVSLFTTICSSLTSCLRGKFSEIYVFGS